MDTYELQSLPSHRNSLSMIPSKEYEGVPGTPFKDELLVPSRRHSESPPIAMLDTQSTSRSHHMFNLLRGLLLPLVAIAYLAFCYTVHSKAVPLRTRLFDDSPDNLCKCFIHQCEQKWFKTFTAVIKSGVTSISIIIITLGLLPIQVLISDLKVGHVPH